MYIILCITSTQVSPHASNAMAQKNSDYYTLIGFQPGPLILGQR